MSEDRKEDAFGWRRCTHEGIGLPGCEVCDPIEEHRASRMAWLDAHRGPTFAMDRGGVVRLSGRVPSDAKPGDVVGNAPHGCRPSSVFPTAEDAKWKGCAALGWGYAPSVDEAAALSSLPRIVDELANRVYALASERDMLSGHKRKLIAALSDVVVGGVPDPSVEAKRRGSWVRALREVGALPSDGEVLP